MSWTILPFVANDTPEIILYNNIQISSACVCQQTQKYHLLSVSSYQPSQFFTLRHHPCYPTHSSFASSPVNNFFNNKSVPCDHDYFPRRFSIQFCFIHPLPFLFCVYDNKFLLPLLLFFRPMYMQIMSIRKFTFVPYFVNHRAFHFFLPHANFSREQSLLSPTNSFRR